MRYDLILKSINNPHFYESVHPEKTSVNKKPSAIALGIKKQYIRKGTVNLDLGGGRFDQGQLLVESIGAQNILIDPYARDYDYNMNSYARLSVLPNGVDTCTLSNVLNVIPSEEVRRDVLTQAFDALADGGIVLIAIYEGNKTGISHVTRSKTFQANLKTSNYLPLISSLFTILEVKNNIIIGMKELKSED